MSVFDKFNDQGMGNRDAFEELCCQLFETWGRRQKNFDDEWIYRNIRGAGGDGGIEAYWYNRTTREYIGLQAKWFRDRLVTGQYRQIQESINTALDLRPKMSTYIVCLPHDLTSMKIGRGKVPTIGEDSDWGNFVDKNRLRHPNLKLVLWDEATICDHLQRPENEGRRRLWFNKSLVNPDSISLALDKALAALRNRYIPELADDGGLSEFLDSFYGTIKSRTKLINDIERCVHTCNEISHVTRSFIAVGDRISNTIRESALACQKAVDDYSSALDDWGKLVRTEPDTTCSIESFDVGYTAIASFELHLRNLKNRFQLHSHVGALFNLFDQFRELPSEWELARRMRGSFSSSHAFVIGDQGTGKTCGFANKAREYLNGNLHLPIFISATDINFSESWFDVIARALGLRNSWDETALWQALSSTAAISDLNENKLTIRTKVAIFVDGLDENPSGFRWPERMRQADAITAQYPRIRFAYSSRRGVLDYARDEDLMDCKHFIDGNGDVPTWKLFDRYVRYYNIDLNGHEHYRWLLRTPMELGMFCLAYKGRRITENAYTCMTGLVDAELNRLEAEFEGRHNSISENLSTPVRRSLSALAGAYLANDKPLDRIAVGKVIEGGGVNKSLIGSLLNFLDDYGILYRRELPGKSIISPKTVMYLPGARHLWDYFMALKLIEESETAFSNLLASHQDAAEMYGILLIERRRILPVYCNELVDALGEKRAYELTLSALAKAEPISTEFFRQWTFDEMGKSKEEFFDVVNEVIVQVAGVHGHPLGPNLLDEYLRTFAKPIDRDVLWSIPRSLDLGRWHAIYDERDTLKHLPKLHADDSFDQMPLLVAWGLSSVSNLRRKHYRNELVQWGLANPQEFSKLFVLFCDCDDPQVREDMHGIAAEIVCMGDVSLETKSELASLVLKSDFAEPDMPGNRNAAIRHYGRVLIERCCTDGACTDDALEYCRPPYAQPSDGTGLPVYPDACSSKKMGGYGPIHYDLARYVLVDKLESVFDFPCFTPRKNLPRDDIQRVMNLSAEESGCIIPTFEGWIIAASYRYLIDHGYCPDILEGPIDNDGCRKDGIDRKIRKAFDCADHGLKSDVMTVAEKYVWCARNEIFGYLADRIHTDGHSWMEERHCDADGRSRHYNELLSFESPIFEATVTRMLEKRSGIVPKFPAPFSCDDGGNVCEREKLEKWFDDVSPDVATVLLGFRPNVEISLKGNIIPVSLFASDWGLGGKGSRVWAYAGFVDKGALTGLEDAETVALDGYSNASEFERSIAISASYISPIEILSAPWLKESDECHDATRIAEVHIKATPLSAGGVDSLVDVGDFWYRYPSRFLIDLCKIKRTDGATYRDVSGNVIFEDVTFGEPYRREYHALLANDKIISDALAKKNCKLIWYVTVQREANSLSRERIPDFAKQVERSWVVWQDNCGSYQSCPLSDTQPEPERNFDIHELLEELCDIQA